MPSRLQDLARRLSPFAARVVEAGSRIGDRIGPTAILGRLDLSLLRAWTENERALREALGADEARAYSELVVAVATVDLNLGRQVAHGLPDHLARVPREGRGRYLRLLRAVQVDRVEALPLVLRTLPPLLEQLKDDALADFLAQALALHRKSPRRAESFLKQESGQSQRESTRLAGGLSLASVQRTLTHYARAHCGADVAVRPGDRAFTDGRHLYLPPRVDHFGDARDFLVYRVLTARNAGYIEHGTLDLDLSALPGDWPTRRPGELELERLFRSFPNSSIARDLFTVLEDLRVEQRVRAEYPGVARDMDALAAHWRPVDPEPRPNPAPAEQAIAWMAETARGKAPAAPKDPQAAALLPALSAAIDAVRHPEASVQDTVVAVVAAFAPLYALLLRAQPNTAPPRSGAGGERGSPAPRDEASAPGPAAPGRSEGERGLDYQPMARDALQPELRTEALSEEDRQTEEAAQRMLEALRAGAEPQATKGEARERARREGSSYAEMDAFLDRAPPPAGPLREPSTEAIEGPLRGASSPPKAADPDAAVVGKPFFYPEWDPVIDDYKPRWVRLTEHRLAPGGMDFVEGVRADHGPLIASVRRAFEALRPEAVRRVRGLPDGDEIDIDRAIAARVERRAGGSPSEHLYMRHLREERDVAVGFLLDMSSSTNEVVGAEARRIIDIEKAALVLIAEAVDAIGDASAIWGFSGYGRDQVAFYIAKELGEPWDDAARARVGRMAFKMENRDGAAIRHATAKMMAWPARVRLLILLSDGKPLDCGCDHYADRYAIEDTRVALVEARKKGVHTFCITVDPQGQRYLEAMYGAGHYTVIDRVDSLPARITQIYRRLTR